MLFNSIDFAIFLPVVFVLYWFVFKNKLKLQNLFILGASYFFYASWDWRFLSLIVFSTLIDYSVGVYLAKENKAYKRKLLLYVSLLSNVGILVFFKYYNFFLDNFIEVFSFFGRNISPKSLNLILPVGISFYTFQTLSYTIDVYRKKLEPTKDIIAFSAFVSFFPQLVAGPIERATNLLPQFYKNRTFNYQQATDGLRQILWGLFKKVVIADNCAEYVNQIFNNTSEYSGSTLALGAVLFSFQIYGDFSGYSDIAIGTSRLFGFNLMQNFAFPYFSRDIAEFWRRWHISLSTWFRDYVYIPLGGSRGSLIKTISNVFIIFIVSGFWHGANWTFIIWGVLNALYFLPQLILKTNRNNIEIVAKGKLFLSLREFFAISITFCLTTLAWVFFRAENFNHAIAYLSSMITNGASYLDINIYWQYKGVIGLIITLIIIEWFGRDNKHALEALVTKLNRPLRYTFYYLIILVIIWYSGKGEEFIYFQF
ncbi:MBOAT family protein [uncultured Winogradskyella sp.]|uniref:MBOAT family O-acyltransferase n=1 Tax=uncultured Winogradskyella sp. TaxID=395353 RepID=UPI0026136220|nr:MBOAT family O-acyltransferase [uncultured Winogradskyella sp.]